MAPIEGLVASPTSQNGRGSKHAASPPFIAARIIDAKEKGKKSGYSENHARCSSP